MPSHTGEDVQRFEEMRDALLPYLQPENWGEGTDRMREFHAACALAVLLPMIRQQGAEEAGISGLRERMLSAEAVERLAKERAVSGDEDLWQCADMGNEGREEWRAEARTHLEEAAETLAALNDSDREEEDRG